MQTLLKHSMVILLALTSCTSSSQERTPTAIDRPVEAPVYSGVLTDATKKELADLAQQYERTYKQSCEGFEERLTLYSKEYIDYFEKLQRRALSADLRSPKRLSLGEVKLIIKIRAKLTKAEIESLGFAESARKLNCHELPYTFAYYGKLTDVDAVREGRVAATYESTYIKNQVFFNLENGAWKIVPFAGTPYGLRKDMETLKKETKEAHINAFLKKKGLESSILEPLNKKE